jgi:hypothetical protein
MRSEVLFVILVETRIQIILFATRLRSTRADESRT